MIGSEHTERRYFPGKILLFGEYSILYGSNAAIIPYRKVQVELTISGDTETDRDSNKVLSTYLRYIERDAVLSEFINLVLFRKDIEAGLSVKSTIPQNRGLGSSGAICAALYDAYRKTTSTDIAELRTLFSRMESWFHGKSSGIDPLCIYLDEPLIISNNEYIPGNNDLLMQNSFKAFLIDTGIASKTGPLVMHFREQMNLEPYAGDFKLKYIPLVNLAVDKWKLGQLDESALFDLSKAQCSFFEKMVPEGFDETWEKGIEESIYALKICGSGGGGMLLGFTRDLEKTGRYLKKNFNISIIKLL